MCEGCQRSDEPPYRPDRGAPPPHILISGGAYIERRYWCGNLIAMFDAACNLRCSFGMKHRASLVVMTLAVSFAGCLGPVPVSLPSVATAPVPDQGWRVRVLVSDERSEKSPARIGLLAIGRDLMLESDVPLATRLEDALVTALRTRGYRADRARDAPPESEVSVVVRVVRFTADVPAQRNVRFQGRSVLVAQTTARNAAASGRAEVIDTREDSVLGDFTRADAVSKLAGRFFQKAAADLVDRVSAGLPPSSGGRR